MARPTKITPAARAAIATGLARASTNIETAAAAGISVDTLARWLVRANRADHVRRAKGKLRDTERPFLSLFDEIRDAEADAEFDALRDVVDALTTGVDLATAAAAAGCSHAMLDRLQERATFYSNRRADGERLDAEAIAYLELFDGYEQAEARQKVAAIRSVQKAGETDWHAAAWWLERRHPDEFASPNKRRAGGERVGGRPLGASSAPDRPPTSDEPPPRIRLRKVDGGA